jgi:hypothetical protein
LEERATEQDAWVLLESLTKDERTQLISFAKGRLAHFGIPTIRDEDLYQQSVCAVLRGIQGSKERKSGRNPRPQDTASKEAFIQYLRGVINSIAEGWARIEYRNPHCSLDVVQAVIAAPKDVEADFREMKAMIFSRMRTAAHARLIPTIDAWEQAPDGRIPCVTSRKHVFAVRKLSQKIARDLGYAPPTRHNTPSQTVAA